MKTTFSRTFFPAAIVLLAALLLVGLSFQILIKDYLEKQAMDRLKSEATTYAQLSEAYYSEPSLPGRDFQLYLSVAGSSGSTDAVICDASGRLLLCSDAPMGCAHQGMQITGIDLGKIFSSQSIRYTGKLQGLYEGNRYVVITPFFQNETPLGFVIVSSSTQASLAVLDRISDIYLLVSALVILAAMIIMSLLTRRVTAPLREMGKAASAFGHGELSARVPVENSSPEEVQDLAIAFNNMAASLQKSEYRRQEFVANISHELKTPMTAISGYVDGMLDGTIPPEKHPQYLQTVSQESKRLSRLVRSMLDISRLQEQGIPEEHKSRFDLTECIGKVLISFEQRILQKNLDIQVDLPECSVYTHASEDAITQVVYNLLDNAIKFCPEGGTLGVQVQENRNKYLVTISNEGETIPPQELPLVFDRFHKLDKSRSQDRDGWGLGLYIVKTLVCSHGEDISVSSKDGNTAFTFTLPQI